MRSVTRLLPLILILAACTAPRPGVVSGPLPDAPRQTEAPSLARTQALGAMVAAQRGTATWYCSDGRDGSPRSACTVGYGPGDLVAAIDRRTGYDKGDRLTVRYHVGDDRWRSVTVLVVDTCGCPGRRVIDLTIGAFQELAPWGMGVIPVTIEAAGPSLTLPPTETAP